MKKKPARVLWVDDDANRRDDAANLEGPGLEVTFMGPALVEENPKALADYDLLLVDYRLNEKGSKDERVHFRGPAVVGILRSESDTIPAYLVSAHLEQRASFSGMTWFDEEWDLARLQDVENARRRIINDIRDYRRIRAVRASKDATAQLLDLLGAPAASKGGIAAAIPASLKRAWAKRGERAEPTTDLTGSLGFARWVRRFLLACSGPLSDDVSIATRVGLTPTRFRKERLFRDCIYAGVFAHIHQEGRWWTAAVDEKLFARRGSVEVGSGAPWEVGPRLFKLTQREYLRCAVCGEIYPDIVALSADDEKTRRAVHTRCSQLDPSRDLTPFFDEPRVFMEAG